MIPLIGESVNIMWVALMPLAFFILLFTSSEITFESKEEMMWYKKLYYKFIIVYIVSICCIPFWVLWMEGII